MGDAMTQAPSVDLESVFGERTRLALAYHEMLATRGIGWGLLGPREVERLWDRHILNSVVLAPMIRHGASVLDVGSGAGLPGIPLALARPDLHVTLLDSLLRRVSFMRLAVDELGLGGQVTVVRARVEDVTQVESSDSRYDVVVARAVAPLWRLLEWCEPVMGEAMLLLKGVAAATEIQEAAEILRRLGLTAHLHRVVPPGRSGGDSESEVTTVVAVVRS